MTSVSLLSSCGRRFPPTLVILLCLAVTVAGLTNLSNAGYAHNWRFGTTIANDTLWAIGLDGGLLAGDLDADHNYLLSVPLTDTFELSDNSNYQLALIGSSVPKLKDQALWTNQANTSFLAYGGRSAANSSQSGGIWSYNTSSETWSIFGGFNPARLEEGATTNAPRIQAAYWVGGYQSSDTTSAISGDEDDYPDSSTGLLEFNTTTQVFTSNEAPFAPVQNGALVYLPVGVQGVLIYIGGEAPDSASGENLTATPNTWDHAWIYDISTKQWYNQTTTGDPPSRTQFCASAAFDNDTSSWQIFVIGGANYQSQDLVPDVWLLSIPSFAWYPAGSLETPLMTMDCQIYGRQILMVGGREKWSNDGTAGDVNKPLNVFDAVQQTTVSSFYPTATAYAAPSSVSLDIKSSPYPSSWANASLAAIFEPQTTSSSPAVSSSTSNSAANKGSSLSGGAIAGIVVGCIAGIIVVVAACLWLLKRRSKSHQAPLEEKGTVSEMEPLDIQEMNARPDPGELPGRERYELMGDHVQELEAKESVH